MNISLELEYMIRTAVYALPPLLLAGLGGMITSKVGILNLGLEGMMLLGAFIAVITNYFTGSSMAGLLAAVILGCVFGWLFAVFNMRLKVNNIILSVGINMFALAVTKYLLGAMFGSSGAFTSDKIVKMPLIPLPFLSKIPILRVFDSLPIVFWIALIITGVMHFILNYTTWGLRIQATGLNDTAVNTAGVNPTIIRYVCLISSGACCGIAGAYLSTSYLAMFTNNMTAGRGFLGNIASIMGNRTALGTFLGSLLFSATDGATMKIQTSGFPSQLVQLIPYVLAFVVIILSAVLKRRQSSKKIY